METVCGNTGNFNFFRRWFKWKQSFGPRKSYFPTNPSFYKPFTFIQSYFLLVGTILEIKCKPTFQEEHYSCSLKPSSWIFADIPASGSCFFRLVETEFSSNPSSRLVYIDFGLISSHVPLFRFFFCCCKALLKLGVNQFSSISSVPISGRNFSS